MGPLQTLVLATVVLLTLAFAPIQGQARPPAGQQPIPSDAEIRQAAGAIEQANGYAELLAATQQYASVISSPRVVEMVDGLLQNPALNDTQRGMLLLERQLSLDTRASGAVAAVRLLAIRVIAGSAVQSDTPQQFATVLEKFSPLAATITVELVRQALNTPDNTWPKPLLPLMEQLARDWPALGAFGAATRMAAAANAAPEPTSKPAPSQGPTLAAHWRKTTIVFGDPRDEHLLLRANGTAETWIVTAKSKTAVTRGNWSAKGTTLSVTWEDGRQWGQAFTFYQGQLVYPNIPNQRQFWDAIR